MVTVWIIVIMVMIMMTLITMTTTTMMWRRRRRKRSSNQCSGERSQCVTSGSWPSPGHAQTPTTTLPTWGRMGWGIFSMSCLATPQTSPEFPNPSLSNVKAYSNYLPFTQFNWIVHCTYSVQVTTFDITLQIIKMQNPHLFCNIQGGLVLMLDVIKVIWKRSSRKNPY